VAEDWQGILLMKSMSDCRPKALSIWILKEIFMECVTGRASDHLTEALQLLARGDEQDWEIELADGDRLEEFIARYPEFAPDDEYAFAMAALIIASFDERVGGRLYPVDGEYMDQMRGVDFDVSRMYTEEERKLWKQVANILKSRLCLFDWHLHYWSCDEEPDFGFACILFFRNEFRNPGA
jgi:hypothetical protein